MFSRGQCSDCGSDGSRCARMGLYADEWKPKSKQSVRMYLQTVSAHPYCAFQYSLTIELSRSNDAVPATGYFTITLDGEAGSADIEINEASPLTLYPKAVHMFPVKTDKHVGKILRASLSYQSSRYIFLRTNLHLWTVRIFSMNGRVNKNKRKNMTLSFCSLEKGGIPHGEAAPLSVC